MSETQLQRWIRVPLSLRLGIFAFLALALRVLSMRTEGFQSGPILCVFRNATGLPCPFCGSTRSVGQILQGNFFEAFSFNPIGFFLTGFAILVAMSPRTVQDISKLISRRWVQLQQKSQVMTVVALILVVWLLNLPRMF